ncbi:hypothetical protein B9Z19DRAFT_1122576 [Tuber borchii]|uniref:Uncharacterized protein n=1 Tax=Tuber borchii TaxID=42251 RepID=A0A2T7A001_TUBBO|nr:hypothetical protein B9Z19DRAFT_1122576 [Tuber borchii]
MPAESVAEEEPPIIEPAKYNTTVATETSTAATAEGQYSDNKDEASNTDPKKDDDRGRLGHLVHLVPKQSLRLAVNIFTARECSRLSPQVLGGTILWHLGVLVHQIKHAENGTEIQGMALSNFSPVSSNQAKLLRVLTALDYRFDPRRPSREVVNDRTCLGNDDAITR